MTREQEALIVLKKKKIKSAAKLGEQMGFTRQRAEALLASLKEKGLIEYVPARWKIIE